MIKLSLGRAMTCYPTLEGEFDQDYKFEASRVVRDGNLVTSMAPGTAMEFSLALVLALLGPEARDRVEEPLILPVMR